MTRGPAWVPMTGPTTPVMMSSRGKIGSSSVEQLVEIGRVAVQHREVLDLPFRRLRGEQLQRLRPGAHLARLLDDAVAQLDHRLDRQHGAEQRAGVADPTTPLEELERVERREQLGAVAPVDDLA